IGGNSGSPVINKNGEIIGLVFDGNIHSLGGDFGFDEALNRTVAVHSAALLEALGKIYAAYRILEELRPQQGSGGKSRLALSRPSLPLDGGGWLRRDVVDHPVNPSHLVGDAGGDLLQKLARKPRPIRGHSVHAGYRPEYRGEFVGPIVAHDANALDRQ